MSTITLPNIRVSSDLTVSVRLKDNGVAIDWSTLQNIKACIYSDAQRALAGRCGFSIDEEDSTLLVCTYAANKPQYLGVNRIVISAKYMGETKTYDKPAFTFVRWTSDQEGEQITIDDPDVDVEISVEDVSSSILQEAVDAAFDAADRANDAAAAAEHMVDIHTGPEGKSAYEVAVEEGYTGTEEEWLASLKGPVGETPDISIGTVTTVEPGTPAAASMTGTPEAPVLNLSIPKGLVGATPNFTVGTVTTGEPGSSVIVTITGTPEAPVLNVTIPQGMQGNTGSSVDYPYELVNNLTTNDATKGLSAAQGYVLDGKVSQLEAKVGEILPANFTVEQGSLLVANGYPAGSSKSLRTVGYLVANGIRVQTSGNNVGVFGYTGAGAYVGCDFYHTADADIYIQHADKYRLIFTKSDNSDVTPEEFASLGITISLIFNGGAVKVTQQGFTNSEKQTARENIDVPSKDDVTIYGQETVNVTPNTTGWRNGYIDTSGRLIFSSVQTSKISGKIPVVPDTDILINQLGCNAAFSSLAAYDVDDNYIADCSICQSTGITQSSPVTIQTTGKNVAYIRVMEVSSIVPNIVATRPTEDGTLKNVVATLKEDYNTFKGQKFVLATEQEFTDNEKQTARENIDAASEGEITYPLTEQVNATIGFANWAYGYIKPNGTIQQASSGAWRYSDKIPIVPDTPIVVNRLYCNTAVASVAAYDASDNFIAECSLSQSSSISPTNPVTIQTTGKNVAYIRITIGGGYPSYDVTVTQYSGVKTIKEVIAEVQEQIAGIEEELDGISVGTQWNGKSWVALGTSITDTKNTLAPDGTTTGKFVPYLAALSGLVVTDKGVAGSVIGGHILYYAGHTAETANADIITIEGGVNDWAGSRPLGQVGDTVPYLVEWSSPVWNNGGSSEGTFAGACYQAIKTAMDNSPKAVVVVITDNTGQNLVGTGANCAREHTNSLGLRQKDYTDMFIAVANYMGVPVINAGQRSMINQDNPEYLIDQIHQTELGGEQFANVIWSELKNFPCRITE